MANLSTLVPAPRPITPLTAGANGGQNNVFVDSSPNNFVITRNGNTTQGTFSPYGDRWSNYFDGTDDYLAIADNVNLRPGSEAFTIEAWVYRFATGRHDTIYAKGGASTGIVLSIINAGNLRFAHSASNFDSTGIIGPGVWTHVAVVREGTGTNQTKLYINGVQDGQGTVSTDFTQTEEARIGTNRGGGDDFGGYISNFRFVKGTAVYTGAFTVPTSPLTAITNTQLLTCKSNRFRDESANAFAVTPNNNTSIQRFSPFSSVAYSTPTIGASGQSDGSGDYLTVADNTAFHFGSGDFTIEAWVYLADNQGGVTKSVISKFEGNAGTGPWALWIQATTLKVRFYLNYTSGFENRFLEGAAVDVGAWCHIAVVRNGSTVTLYQNGVSTATLAVSTNSLYVDSGAVVVLDDRNFTRNLKGNISDLRIVKGTAQYAANFTPPTAPLTAITNTSLLLNFTNAAILDNAMACTLETVGNAQISTSVKKYGTGSLYFDGTGDWMFTPDSIDQRIGEANFTIECWLYLASTGAARGIVNKGGNTTGWALSVNATNNVVFTDNSSAITSTGALSGSTWYHIAVVREGTGTNQTKIYIDGTNDGTGTVSSGFTQSERTRVGANRSGGDPMNGYIDDLRITKGVARYTANFTPPQAALANDRNTVLLLNADSTSTSNIQVDTYTTTGTVHTWTKPVGAKAVMINIRGAGGGGGGGSGTGSFTRLGGGGGGGGARVEQVCTADAIPSTLYVIVGAGGAGGAAGNPGSQGTAGGNSFVAKNSTNPPVTGIVAFAGGGGGGSGGNQNGYSGGGGGGGCSGQGATNNGSGNAPGGWPGSSGTGIASNLEFNGGAGGLGIRTVNIATMGIVVEWGGGGGGSQGSWAGPPGSGQDSMYGSGGGASGKCFNYNTITPQTGTSYGGSSGFYDGFDAGTPSGADGANGSAGSAGNSYLVTGNGGGGGGGGGAGTSGTGGVGGAGGLGGGGGGGGGVGTSSGGAGGAGGNGVVEIITYF